MLLRQGLRQEHRLARASLRRLATTAKIPVKMSPHVLRHTCATLARDAGARLEVQEQLGHADARTTRRYDHGGQRLDRRRPTPFRVPHRRRRRAFRGISRGRPAAPAGATVRVYCVGGSIPVRRS
ncbi:tyrosine-type recombinase/integrase [Micromonospora sp. NPDC049051]|uniref:tyrosine-type recombinase/integrase n=1 Tax=Micromonospora sp. NPDC049051 TaxID=3364264 RepID=UPI00371DB633